jgi:hypothetical protein
MNYMHVRRVKVSSIESTLEIIWNEWYAFLAEEEVWYLVAKRSAIWVESP